MRRSLSVEATGSGVQEGQERRASDLKRDLPGGCGLDPDAEVAFRDERTIACRSKSIEIEWRCQT